MYFEQFNSSTYEEALEIWSKEAETCNIFPQEVVRQLKWIKESLSTQATVQSSSLAYGVFTQKDKSPVAVCELVISQKGKNNRWMKLLNVTLSPAMEAKVEAKDLKAIKTAVTAYRTAVAGSFDAKNDHDIDTLKLYGRNKTMLDLLITTYAALEDSESFEEIKKEGRWLVLCS